MSKDFDNHRWIFDGGDDLQATAAVGAVFDVDVEDPFEQPGPTDARRGALRLSVLAGGLGGTLWRSGNDLIAQLGVGRQHAMAEVREVETGGGRERNLNVVLNLATAVKEEWLREMFPQGFAQRRAVVYDPALRRVVVREEKRFRDLLLDETVSDRPPADEAAALLAREVVAGRLVLENWDEAVEQWILRLNRLREWMPELELPGIAETDRTVMIEHLCHGAVSYNEIRNRPVLPAVKSWLSRQQQGWIDEYTPERIQLPKGRMVKVAYFTDNAPTIAARIQDLYGIKDALWIANRRVRVRIQILAPSNRPVQITENLGDFWRDTYPKLKQQLQRRYPKHEWR